jgi:hypothetical protein
MLSTELGDMVFELVACVVHVIVFACRLGAFTEVLSAFDL